MIKMFKKYLEDFKAGTITMFKEFFNKSTNKKQRANMWSFSRLIIPLITLILSITAVITSIIPLFIASGVLAGFGAITDWLDGKSSKVHKSASEYGKILDQATDKFFSIVIGANLSYLNPAYLIVLLGEFLIGGINIYYKSKYKNIDIKSTKIGKGKQWVLYPSLALGYFSTINNVMLTIANVSVALSFITQIITSCSYIKQNNEEVKKLKIENDKEKLLVIDGEEENEKEKTLEAKKVNLSNQNGKDNISRVDKIEQLKKLKDELTTSENTKNISEKQIVYQKNKFKK